MMTSSIFTTHPRTLWGAMLIGWTCTNQTKTEDVVKLSDKTTAQYCKDGVNGDKVWHYKIKQFGHRFPHKENGTGINSVKEIWRFFKKMNVSDE
jgi:poly(3-hydroxybutyrate) depolymerase